MREIVNIPCDSSVLHGVAHLPQEDSAARVGLLIISLNDINSKLGPHRLYSELADAAARAGFHVLRYDNRGTGDSPGVCDPSFAQRVKDARTSIGFFRTRYRLEAVVGWGLCLGASVTAHCTVGVRGEERVDGMILCNILAQGSRVSHPELDYKIVDIPTLCRHMFLDGNLLRKLRQAPRKLHIYRKNVPKLATNLLKRYGKERQLEQQRSGVARVGELLASYPGPCLMIFGGKDAYWTCFLEQVNPGDRLGLAKKRLPLDWAIVDDGDHTFASREQTNELVGYTLQWLERFRREHAPSLAGSLA